MARNDAQVFDQVLKFFLGMAQEMDYVKTVEETFRNSPLVVPVIDGLYIAIIDFWVKAVKYYRRKFKGRAIPFLERLYAQYFVPGTLARIKTFLCASNIAQEFDKLKDGIAMQHDLLSKVSAAQHHADYASYHQQSQQQLQTARQVAFIKWINAPSYESDFHAADKRHYEGTCEWMTQKEEYQHWGDKISPRHLWHPWSRKDHLKLVVNQTSQTILEHGESTPYCDISLFQGKRL